MTGLWVGLGVAGLAWLGVAHYLDRPSVPAWQAKYAYRVLAHGFFLLGLAAFLKAVQYHTELVWVIRYCR